MSDTASNAIKAYTKALYSSEFSDSLPSKKELYKFMHSYLKECNGESEPQPDPELLELKEEYTQKLGKKPSGSKVNDKDWLKSKIADFERPKTEVELLKDEYLAKLGKKAGGPKANDIEWLKSKIDQYDSRSDEEIERAELKAEYEKLFGKKPRGPNTIEWLKSKIADFERPKTEVQLLKDEYFAKLGKKPSGPKTNDIEWLKSKIDEFDSRSDEDIERAELKVEYFTKLGKKPSGPKTNDIEWLKSKIAEYEEKKKSDEGSDGDSDEGSDGDSVGKFGFVFEGVSYTRTFEYSEKEWKVEDEDGNEVGIWIDDDADGKIEWIHEDWNDIHKEHEDYDPTLSTTAKV